MKVVLDEAGRGYDERFDRGYELVSMIFDVELVLDVLLNQVEELLHFVLHGYPGLFVLLLWDVFIDF